MKRTTARKTLSVLLSLILVLANISLVAFAAESTPEYTTKEDIVGYSAALVERKDLSKVENITKYWDDEDGDILEWKITSASDLVFFAQLVKLEQYFNDMTVYLANDIDLSSVENFEPIGGWTTAWGKPYFCGKFDGQGYTIKNMKMVVPSTGVSADIGYFGFFRLLGPKAEVCNLIFDKSCVVSCGNNLNVGSIGVVCGAIDTTTGNVGAIVENTIKFSNIYSEATLIHGGGIAAVFVPYAKSSFVSIDHCTAAGDMQVVEGGTGAQLNGGSGVAGFVGMVGEATKNYCVSITITNSRNVIDVEGGLAPAGGFIGMACKSKAQVDERSIIIENCINNGDVTMSDVTKYPNGRGVAGFVGWNNFDTNGSTVTLKNCINYGTVTAPDATLEPAPTVATSVSEFVNDTTIATEAKTTATTENCTASAGQEDATLAEALWQNLVTLAPAPGGDEQTPGGDEQTPGGDEQTPGGDEQTPGGDEQTPGDNKTDDTEPVTEAPTTATTPATEEESGCKSVVAIIPVMLVTLGAAVLTFKKKED